MHAIIETWNDLLEALKTASPEQLQQPVQICQHHPVDEYVHELMQGICFGTVDEMDLRYTRSVTDNRRHGEHLIIYADNNPFAEDGAIAHEIDLNTEVGQGQLFNKIKSIYPKNFTKDQDWTGPAQKIEDAKDRKRGKGFLVPLLKKRINEE